jgi:hypothetical protein
LGCFGCLGGQRSLGRSGSGFGLRACCLLRGSVQARCGLALGGLPRRVEPHGLGALRVLAGNRLLPRRFALGSLPRRLLPGSF